MRACKTNQFGNPGFLISVFAKSRQHIRSYLETLTSPIVNEFQSVQSAAAAQQHGRPQRQGATGQAMELP